MALRTIQVSEQVMADDALAMGKAIAAARSAFAQYDAGLITAHELANNMIQHGVELNGVLASWGAHSISG